MIYSHDTDSGRRSPVARSDADDGGRRPPLRTNPAHPKRDATSSARDAAPARRPSAPARPPAAARAAACQDAVRHVRRTRSQLSRSEKKSCAARPRERTARFWRAGEAAPCARCREGYAFTRTRRLCCSFAPRARRLGGRKLLHLIFFEPSTPQVRARPWSGRIEAAVVEPAGQRAASKRHKTKPISGREKRCMSSQV